MIKHLKSLASVVIGAAMLLLITIINGQPFFYPDTSNYVRAPDAAVVWLFGKRFATPWTTADVIKVFNPHSDERNNSDGLSAIDRTSPHPDKPATVDPHDQHTNSFEKGIIISGRSAFYGVLLYLGAISGGFWFSVFLQALVTSYLVFILSVRCFGLPVPAFIVSIGCLSFFSTAPFFVGFLMPYVFAAVTILVTGIFVVFWGDLSPRERFVLAIILLFAVLSHATHLLICISMLATYLVASLVRQFRIAYFRIGSIATISACILVGILGDISFGPIVKKISGVSPIRPPLIMARFINLGPGYRYLEAHCGDNSFAICQFRARLPVDTDSFIWNPDPVRGIFAPATKETKRALADEQFSFATKVLLFDPIGILSGMLSVSGRQLITFNLEEFRKSGNWNQFARLPTQYWSRMQETIAFKDGWVIDVISKMDYIIVIISGLILILVTVLFAKKSTTKYFPLRADDDWASIFSFCAVIVIGIAVNAFVCASFSAVHSHYQARVIWLIPLLAFLLVARCYAPGRGYADRPRRNKKH